MLILVTFLRIKAHCEEEAKKVNSWNNLLLKLLGVRNFYFYYIISLLNRWPLELAVFMQKPSLKRFILVIEFGVFPACTSIANLEVIQLYNNSGLSYIKFLLICWKINRFRQTHTNIYYSYSLSHEMIDRCFSNHNLHCQIISQC